MVLVLVYLFSFIFAFAQRVCHPITTYSRNSFHISGVKMCSRVLRWYRRRGRRRRWVIRSAGTPTSVKFNADWFEQISPPLFFFPLFQFALHLNFSIFKKRKAKMRRLKWFLSFCCCCFSTFFRFDFSKNAWRIVKYFLLTSIERASWREVDRDVHALHYQYKMLHSIDCQIVIWLHKECASTETAAAKWFINV